MPDKLRVALIGVYPPPIGGVSIHIRRLLSGCLDNNIRCTVVDISRHLKKAENVLNLIRFRDWPRILFSRQDIVHIHTTDMHWKMPALFFCLAKIKGSRIVLSYHSLRDMREFSSMGQRMMKFMLKSVSHCIAINPDIKEKLGAMGARPEKISVIPSFLPPPVRAEEIAEIPRETWDFIAGHKPVIAANAYAIIKYQGQDLYGIDMCIELCAALKNIYPGVGLVFFLPRIGDNEYFDKLKRRISEKGVEDDFLFQTTPCQLYPVLMKSDIFVRPTAIDSYGISVAEAVHFQVPAVASDVCLRPGGTVLFKSRDMADFIAKVQTVWENYTEYKRKLASPQMPDILKEILSVYSVVAGRKK